MSFDFNDRMAIITKGATTTMYYYDAGQDRSVKFEQTTHNYKIYPNKYIEDTRANGKKKYIFLGDLRLGTIDQTSTSTPLLYLNFSDHLNSASITTDSQGNVTNLNDYLPYGGDRVSIQNGTFIPSYKFTDHELDNESGIYSFGNRFYNQGIGRFIQADPVSLYLYDNNQLKEKVNRSQQDILVNPQNLNNYSYAINNPIVFRDKDGQFPMFFYAAAARFNPIVEMSFLAIGAVSATSFLGSALGYTLEGDFKTAQAYRDAAGLSLAGSLVSAYGLLYEVNKTQSLNNKVEISNNLGIKSNEYGKSLQQRYSNLTSDIKNQLLPKYNTELAGEKITLELKNGDKILINYRKELGITDKSLSRTIVLKNINNQTQSVYHEVIDQNDEIIHIDKKY